MRTLVVFLLFVSVVWAQSSEKFKEVIRPHAEVCKEKLDATDGEMNALIDLQIELYTDKVKCLTACVMEELGAMRNGSWTAVAAEKRAEVYRRMFEDDPLKLQVTDIVIHKCDTEADEKYPDKGKGCDVVFDAMECMWQVMQQATQKIEL